MNLAVLYNFNDTIRLSKLKHSEVSVIYNGIILYILSHLENVSCIYKIEPNTLKNLSILQCIASKKLYKMYYDRTPNKKFSLKLSINEAISLKDFLMEYKNTIHNDNYTKNIIEIHKNNLCKQLV